MGLKGRLWPHKADIGSFGFFEDPVSVTYQSQLLSNHAKTYSEDDEVRKLSLSDWGSVAEIVATVAVVISLIFVVISLERNTAVMQASNDNFIYELQYGRVRDIVSSPGMASIYVKHRNGEDLSAEEKERFYWADLQVKWYNSLIHKLAAIKPIKNKCVSNKLN